MGNQKEAAKPKPSERELKEHTRHFNPAKGCKLCEEQGQHNHQPIKGQWAI